jgi:hypothetical protein
VKRTRADEPVRVVIYICMETTQGNSLCSYLYLKLAKMSCFSFYLFSFYFYKVGEQSMEQVLVGGWHCWSGWGGGRKRG